MRESRKSCQNAMLLFVSKVVVIIRLSIFFFFFLEDKDQQALLLVFLIEIFGSKWKPRRCHLLQLLVWVCHINNRGSEEVLTDGIKNSNIFCFLPLNSLHDSDSFTWPVKTACGELIYFVTLTGCV